MRKILVALVLLFASSGLAQAQAANSEGREAVKKLNFLVGQWKGEGWVQFGPGQRQTVSAIESVQVKLGGEVLLIEGLGRNRTEGNQPEVTGHDAIAFLYYDAKARVFRFQAHRAGGLAVDSEAKVTDRSFEWGFSVERAGMFRFTMNLTDKDEWFEIGETSRDGKTWHKFLEMTLQRVK
jgi:hypothetical protein